MPRQAGRIPRSGRDKAPHTTHHRQVIRADLTPRPRPAADLGEAVPAPSRQAREQAELGENPGTSAFPPPAPVPAWARASGRAGEGYLFSAGAGLALLDACPAPRPARRRGAAGAPGASERRGLRHDPAPQRRRRRAARPALRRRRRRPGRAAASALAGSRRPAAQPRPRPACRRGGAARAGRGPERPRLQPESLRRGGRSGLCGR